MLILKERLRVHEHDAAATHSLNRMNIGDEEAKSLGNALEANSTLTELK